MVALLLRLRFRVLANTLRRNVLQTVAVVLGAVQGVALLALVLFGLWVLPGVGYQQPVDVIQRTVVIGGAALVLGWMFVPVIVNGIEQTLDPVKLAPFPLRTSQLMAAMMLVGVTWVPGGVSILIAVGTALAWRETPAWPVAVLSGALGAVIAIAGSRMIATLTGNLLAGRRLLTRIGVLSGLAVLVAGPVVGAVVAAARAGSDAFAAATNVLAWSPIGAVWSIPGRLVEGDARGAAGAAVIALATLAVILLVWHRALAVSLRHRGAVAARTVSAGRLGLLGLVPTGPVGAIAARGLIYWFRDARYARQLVMIPVLPLLLLVWSRLIHAEGLGLAAGPAVAGLLPLSMYASLSFDGTAFAGNLAAGVPGVADRRGRAIAIATISLPAVALVLVATGAVLDAWRVLPALAGIAIGVMLTALGVISVSSARIVIPVPRAGRNPFSAAAGAGMTSVVGSYVVTGATSALALPEVVLGVIAVVTGTAWLGWLALAVGVVLGGALLAVGTRVGGRILDRSGPVVLARLKLIRA